MEFQLRVFQIWWVCRKFGLGEGVLRIQPSLSWISRMFWRCSGISFSLKSNLPLEERFALALEALGPLYVKVGQLLSTRRDLLSEEFAACLSRLQDRVAAFDSEQAKEVVEQSLGAKLDTFFGSFDTEPLASASMAQVHGATLKDGRAVVVKILRPNIEKQIKKDLGFLYFLAKLLPNFFPSLRRFRLLEVVSQIERTLLAETDFMAEAANASVLRRHFQVLPQVFVPEVIWSLTRKNILVSERAFGIPIAHKAELLAAGVDLKKLASIGIEIFFRQVFEFSFFHADLHPGNIFIDAKDPENPRYQLLDFGIVGSLSSEDQHYLAANFLAFFERDYRRVAKLHSDSGWIPKEAQLGAFESAMRTVSEPILGRPLQEISLGLTLGRLFQVAKDFDMEIQPQLLLLQKTLLNIESLGRYLHPELDLWGACRPFFKKWMKQQIGLRGLWRRMQEEAPILSERLPQIPGMLYRILHQLDRPVITVKRSKGKFFLGLVLGGILGGLGVWWFL